MFIYGVYNVNSAYFSIALCNKNNETFYMNYMWRIHHVSENMILNQGCSEKCNNSENIHVDNTK